MLIGYIHGKKSVMNHIYESLFQRDHRSKCEKLTKHLEKNTGDHLSDLREGKFVKTRSNTIMCKEIDIQWSK